MIKNTDSSLTFSKRKFSAFKKADELSTLCGSELAVVMFSPSGKAFSYGHPIVNSILDQFMGLDPLKTLDPISHEFLEAQNNFRVREIEARIVEVEDMFKLEQKREQILSLDMTNHAKKRWWEQSIEEMSLSELHLRKDKMEELKMFFEERKKMKMLVE
ncbi:agamous-like MADS-box protein AGL62 [Impatiens glandulifera]|uniref:agamous-like MADS-box protein AGL62 n=1 Tax=Impatiens glandulifera TaxID=253017 RepID=UPI001FB13B63|nr:agamous-like MADS-box protein AGL62 [Impatiens glandulifera]